MWAPQTTTGRSFLTINGIDEDSSHAEKAAVLGEEVEEGYWVNPEPKVFRRDQAGNIREMWSLQAHMERKAAEKEAAYKAGVEQVEHVNPVPPITWGALYRVHESMTEKMCKAFMRPIEEWPLFVPFNPMVEVPYDPVSKTTYYTFTPPAGYKLWEKDAGYAWVREVVGNNIIGMIAAENGMTTAAVLETLNDNSR